MKLKVFDIDGTLLKSPMYNKNHWVQENPKVYDRLKHAWWESRLSLGPPFFECPSDSEMHIPHVVEAALEAVQDDDCIVCVMTGRVEKLRDLMEMHVVQGMGIEPDYFHLRSPFTKTLSYKMKAIDEIINEFEVTHVEMWDDKDSYIPQYNQFLEDHLPSLSFDIHHIEEEYVTHIDLETEKEIVKRILGELDLKHHLKHHAK